MTASKTCAVQMLLVALSRRIVLLAGLEREAHGGAALRVVRDADEPAGHVALEFLARGEKAGVGSAIAERHAEALRGTDGDVGAELARRLEQREREQIGGDGDPAPDLANGVDEAREIADDAVGGRVLQERAEDGGVGIELGRVADHDLDALRHRAGADDVEGSADGSRPRRRICSRRGATRTPWSMVMASAAAVRLVEQRGVGDVEAGQVGDHGLEIEQRLQPALGDLGLVGRVGGVPAGGSRGCCAG